MVKMRVLFIIIISLTAGCLSLHSQVADSIKYQSLEPHAFQKTYMTEDNAILIDVREFFEFRKSRIKGAINIPSSGGYDIAADTIGKDKSLFFYCYSGGRSRRAAEFFYNKGFRKIFNLADGITAWKKEGMPVAKKRLRIHNARRTGKNN
jgi:rhodanese-related sulfurtransferase